MSRWAAVGLGVALAFFTATAALSYRNQQRIAETGQAAHVSRLLSTEVGNLVAVVQAAETAQRAYLLAQTPVIRQGYSDALAQARKRVRDLARLEDSAEHRPALGELARAATARLDHLERTVDLFGAQGAGAAQTQIRQGQGDQLMRELRSAALIFQQRATRELQEAEEESDRVRRLTRVTDLLAAALGLGLAALAFARLRQEFLDRHVIAQDREEKRELLQVTFDSIGEAIVTTDPESRVRSLNGVAERLLGWRAAEAAGRPMAEVFRIGEEAPGSASDSTAARALREARETRVAFSTLLVARDDTERRIEGSAAPIRTTDDRLLGTVVTFRDVTDRKRAEEALRRSEERLCRALRASRMIAWEYDVRTDVVVRTENATEMLGLPSFGAVSEYIALIDPEDREAVAAALDRALRGEADFAAECRLRLPDGGLLWVVDKGEVRRDAHGDPTHVAGVLMDVTGLRRAEQELREADRRKDRFLATLAHELRNPLAPLSNALQAWPFVNPAELDPLRETMERQVAQMTRLIDDLLDISRITRGKLSLRRETTDLRKILDAAIEGVRPLLDARGHALRMSLPAPTPLISGDVARLVQIFTNLLQNAAKYTDPGGRIEIMAQVDAGTTPAPDRVTVSIADNGAGIPAPVLDRIFDMFAQADETLDRAHGGLGIGLTLVRNLVELHGGSVTAESDGPQLGSTFRVTLPLAGAADEPAPSERRVWPTGGDLPALRMLVVDDMRPSARTLAMMLNGIGQKTCVAHDGLSALTAVDEFRPDVVLLDIAMPGMDGYEVCKRLRERFAASPALRPLLVALTGYAQEEDRRRAFEAGFDRHLVKPTSLDALKELLAGANRSGDRAAGVP